MSERRLLLEHESLCETLVRSDHVWLARTSLDLRRHELFYAVRTVVRDATGFVREEDRELGMIFELHPMHPKIPPLVVCQSDELFHPNVHDPRRGDPPFAIVCMGTFHAQLRLGDWVVGLWDLLSWRRRATDHPLNPDAAAWARLQGASPRRFPTDSREFSRPRRPGSPQEETALTQGPAGPPGLRLVSPWRHA